MHAGTVPTPLTRHVRILRWEPRMFRKQFRSHSLQEEVNAALELGWKLGAVSGFDGGTEFTLLWFEPGEPRKTPFQLWQIEEAARDAEKRASRKSVIASRQAVLC